MRFQPKYETDSTGDFANIKTRAQWCFWTTGSCNWPARRTTQRNLDDLWHAAVNAGDVLPGAEPDALRREFPPR